MAYWFKCWPAIGRLQVRAPLSAGFFALEYTQLHPQNEEMFVTASFGGDVKSLLLVIFATPASSKIKYY